MSESDSSQSSGSDERDVPVIRDDPPPKRAIKIINRNAAFPGTKQEPVLVPSLPSSPSPELPNIPRAEPQLPKYFSQNGVPSSAIVDWIPPPPELPQGFTPVEFINPVKQYPRTNRERHRHHRDATDSFSDKSTGNDKNNRDSGGHKQFERKFGRRLLEIMNTRKAKEEVDAKVAQEKAAAAGKSEIKKNYSLQWEASKKDLNLNTKENKPKPTGAGDNTDDLADRSGTCKKPEHKYKCYNLTLLPDFQEKPQLYVGVIEWVRKCGIIPWVESGGKDICGDCESCFVEQAMAAFKISKRLSDQKNIIRVTLCTVYQTFKDGTDFYWAPEKAMQDMGVPGIQSNRIFSERLQAERAKKQIKDYTDTPKRSGSESTKHMAVANQKPPPKRKIVVVGTVNPTAILGDPNMPTASTSKEHSSSSLTRKFRTVDKIVADELAKADLNNEDAVQVDYNQQESPVSSIQEKNDVDLGGPPESSDAIHQAGKIGEQSDLKQDGVFNVEDDDPCIHIKLETPVQPQEKIEDRISLKVPVNQAFPGSIFGNHISAPNEHKFNFDVNATEFVPSRSPVSEVHESITFKPRKSIKILRTLPFESIFGNASTAASPNKRHRSPSSEEEEGVKIALSDPKPVEDAKKIKLESKVTEAEGAKAQAKENRASEANINANDAKSHLDKAVRHCMSNLTEIVKDAIKENSKKKVEDHKPEVKTVQKDLKETKPATKGVDSKQPAKEVTTKTNSSGELTKEDLKEIFSKQSPNVRTTIDITGDDKAKISDAEEQEELHLKLGASSSHINGNKPYGSKAISKKYLSRSSISTPSSASSQSSQRDQPSKIAMKNEVSNIPTPTSKGLPTEVKEKAFSQVAPALIDFVRKQFIPMLESGEVKHEHHCNLQSELLNKMDRNVDEMDELQLRLVKRIARNLDLFIQLSTPDCSEIEAKMPDFSQWDPTEDIHRHLNANLPAATKVRSNRSMHDPRYQKPDARSTPPRGPTVNVQRNPPPHLQGRNRSHGKFPTITPSAQATTSRNDGQPKVDKSKSSAPGSFLRGINLKEQEDKREWMYY